MTNRNVFFPQLKRSLNELLEFASWHEFYVHEKNLKGGPLPCPLPLPIFVDVIHPN
jgi:hypothetical protein